VTAHSPVATCRACGQRLLTSPSSPTVNCVDSCPGCVSDRARAWIATDRDNTPTLLVPDVTWLRGEPQASAAFSRRRAFQAFRENCRNAREDAQEPVLDEELDEWMAGISLQPIRESVRLAHLLAALRGEFHATVYVRI